MGYRFPVQAKTSQLLSVMANPSAATQPDAVSWVLWDTLTYTSGTTIQQVFFQNVQGADKSLSNMVSQGQLPEPQYFEVYQMGLDVLQTQTANAGHTTTGALDNIAQLVLVGRGWMQLNVSGKAFAQAPLSHLHTSGGPTGYGFGTLTAESQQEFANNSVPDGGFWVGGGVIIPPKQAFDVTLSWPAAVTLTGNLPLRVWLAGVLHRKVN